MKLVEELQTDAWVMHGAISLYTIAASCLRIAVPHLVGEQASSSSAGQIGLEEEYQTIHTLALTCFVLCIKYDPQCHKVYLPNVCMTHVVVVLCVHHNM